MIVFRVPVRVVLAADAALNARHRDMAIALGLMNMVVWVGGPYLARLEVLGTTAEAVAD